LAGKYIKGSKRDQIKDYKPHKKEVKNKNKEQEGNKIKHKEKCNKPEK
jgi:hypothetical protein